MRTDYIAIIICSIVMAIWCVMVGMAIYKMKKHKGDDGDGEE